MGDFQPYYFDPRWVIFIRPVTLPVITTYGEKLDGPRYMAELYAGTDILSLAPIGPPVPFLGGAGAGYFLGGTRAIPTVTPGGTATFEVRVWDSFTGATWEKAYVRARGGTFRVVTGGAGSPPSLPANLAGLKSFFLDVPEASTFALGVIGAAALLVKSRGNH